MLLSLAASKANAPIAQWIEHWFPKPGVACSSNAGRAIFSQIRRSLSYFTLKHCCRDCCDLQPKCSQSQEKLFFPFVRVALFRVAKQKNFINFLSRFSLERWQYMAIGIQGNADLGMP